MKNLKSYKLFESDSDVDYHIRLIKDIFYDVIDEFGAYEYGGGDPAGLYYKISDRGFGIRLWMAYCNEWGVSNKSIENEKIKSSKTVDDFENRLIGAGYKFYKKPDCNWYEIEIETPE